MHTRTHTHAHTQVSLSEMVDKKELAWPPGESLNGTIKAPSKAKGANANAAPKVGDASSLLL